MGSNSIPESMQKLHVEAEAARIRNATTHYQILNIQPTSDLVFFELNWSLTYSGRDKEGTQKAQPNISPR